MDRGIIDAKEAQGLLGVRRSQVYKILCKYRQGDISAIVSKKRQRVGNRAIPLHVREKVLGLIRDRYRDYGPTLATEMMAELHGITLSVETVRKWMINDGLWLTDRRARRLLHQPRRRAGAYGHLIQIDGSDHDWFEGRGPRCTLMVFVDDASGRIQHLRFFKRENRDAYFISTRDYIVKHGLPVRLLTDRHSAVYSLEAVTDYTRALSSLNIIHSFAWSAQSKGRVERLNRTLQDRLVKALRRENISTIDSANVFVTQYIERFNMRFQRNVALEFDTHRCLGGHHDLESSFSRAFERRLSRQATFSFEGTRYAIVPSTDAKALFGKVITIEQRLDGGLAAFFDGRRIDFRQCP